MDALQWRQVEKKKKILARGPAWFCHASWRQASHVDVIHSTWRGSGQPRDTEDFGGRKDPRSPVVERPSLFQPCKDVYPSPLTSPKRDEMKWAILFVPGKIMHNGRFKSVLMALLRASQTRRLPSPSLRPPPSCDYASAISPAVSGKRQASQTRQGRESERL